MKPNSFPCAVYPLDDRANLPRMARLYKLQRQKEAMGEVQGSSCVLSHSVRWSSFPTSDKPGH